MARPKYLQNDLTAKEKLVEAFWEVLENSSFEKMTVSEITGKAKLHRNSFYYYYEDINHMGKSIVEETLAKELPALILAQTESLNDISSLTLPSDFEVRFKRICLIASEKSGSQLRKMLKDAISEIWREALNIDLEALKETDRLIFEFTLGGVMALLAYQSTSENKVSMPEMLETDFMKSLLRHFSNLASIEGQKRLC